MPSTVLVALLQMPPHVVCPDREHACSMRIASTQNYKRYKAINTWMSIVKAIDSCMYWVPFTLTHRAPLSPLLPNDRRLLNRHRASADGDSKLKLQPRRRHRPMDIMTPIQATGRSHNPPPPHKNVVYLTTTTQAATASGD